MQQHVAFAGEKTTVASTQLPKPAIRGKKRHATNSLNYWKTNAKKTKSKVFFFGHKFTHTGRRRNTRTMLAKNKRRKPKLWNVKNSTEGHGGMEKHEETKALKQYRA